MRLKDAMIHLSNKFDAEFGRKRVVCDQRSLRQTKVIQDFDPYSLSRCGKLRNGCQVYRPFPQSLHGQIRCG